MSLELWLLTAFILLNIGDVLTTWWGVHHLPLELRASEANPIQKSVERSLLPAIVCKVVIIIFVAWLALGKGTLIVTLDSIALLTLDFVMLVAVLNNLYVCVSRVVKKRKVTSPVMLVTKLLEALHLSSKIASRAGFYLLFGVVIVLSRLAAGAIL